jgi:hypothetical protein
MSSSEVGPRKAPTGAAKGPPRRGPEARGAPRGRINRVAAAIRQGGAAAAERTPLPVVLLSFAVLVPTSFSLYIGSLRFSPYRIVLLLATPLLLNQLLSGAAGRLTRSDWLILGAAVWMWVSLLVNDGASAVESGGVIFAETFGPYLIGRCCIRTATQWIGAVTLMGTSVAILSLFTVPESLTGIHLIQNLSGIVKGTGPSSKTGHINMRMGFHRAYGPFDHPILLGVVSATFTVALAHVSLVRRQLMVLVPMALATTLTSISSGALAVLGVAGLLSAWDSFARSFPKRWVAFLALLGVGYVGIEMFSNRSAIVAVLSYVTLNPSTAVGRTIIWEYGFHYNAVKNPFFGLGLVRGVNWFRPHWLGPSIDNYFLYLMVFHGIVPAALLLVGIVMKIRAAALASVLPGVGRLAASWWIPMVGFVIAAWTVAFWNQAQVLFWFFIGCGSWIEREWLRAKAAGRVR